jgi:glycine cleavage system regulatory protein
MRSSLVLTVIGPDRPGIVETLAATLAAHGGNWEQSQMAHLAGQFAGILQVSVDEPHKAELRAALEGLATRDLRVISVNSVQAARPATPLLLLELTGTDRKGIVHEVARALAARQVNIDELETSCESAPMSGEGIFHARALLRVPSPVDQSELQHMLEALADDLMVDISLLPPER